jgi:hypothetical protein
MSVFLLFPGYKQRLRDKRKYYEKFSEEYISAKQLLQLTEMPFTQRLITENEIKFRNKLKFGAKYTHVTSLLGKPWVSYRNPCLNGHQILLYKYYIGTCNVKCEVHLFQNTFVMGKYISDCITNNRQFLKQYFLGKYLEHKFLPDYSNTRIADTSNNVIFVNDSVQIEFLYLWHLAPSLFVNN